MKIAPCIKIPVIYAVFGAMWIFFSDKILEILVADAELYADIQTVKGWFYVLITSILLFHLIRSDYKKILEKEEEKRSVFLATLEAAHHVLNNFLNQMLLFKHEAQESEDFSPDVLALYDDVIDDAKQQLANLSAIKELSSEAIKESVYPK